MSELLSQNQKVLNWLKGGNTLTSMQAITNWGITRLAARIRDLKKAGYDNIKATTKTNGRSHYAVYHMEKDHGES